MLRQNSLEVTILLNKRNTHHVLIYKNIINLIFELALNNIIHKQLTVQIIVIVINNNSE